MATPLALHEGPKPDTITNPSLSPPGPTSNYGRGVTFQRGHFMIHAAEHLCRGHASACRNATKRPQATKVLSRSRRVSSFRGLPQRAPAPMRNCLDFGWRIFRLQYVVSLARICGDGEVPACPAPQMVQGNRRGQIMIGCGASSRPLRQRPAQQEGRHRPIVQDA